MALKEPIQWRLVLGRATFTEFPRFATATKFNSQRRPSHVAKGRGVVWGRAVVPGRKV